MPHRILAVWITFAVLFVDAGATEESRGAVSESAGASDPATTAEDASWRAGMASVKITPDYPVRMAGYSSRTGLSRGVAHDLYAKALALEDGNGHQAILITADLIAFPAVVAAPICERVSQRTGVARSQILLNASHTHTGPALGLDAAALDFSADQAEVTLRYTRQLQDQLVDLAVTSLERLGPAQLWWGVGVENFAMNRRQFTERGVRLGVSPSALVDRSVPILRIETPTGELVGVLFGAACHNTTLTGEHLMISGDYAGYAQALVSAACGGAAALFVQGCGGDANPYPRGSDELARLHGRTLADEVLRILSLPKAQPDDDGQGPYEHLLAVRGPLKTELAQVDLPLQTGWSREKLDSMVRDGEGWQRFVAEKMLAQLDAGAPLPVVYSAPVAVWQFGSDLTFVALPGEAVVDYVALLEQALHPQRLWIAAYANDVFGYLPSARTLSEGGYETRGLYAGSVGIFAAEAQDVVVQAVTALARRAGRPTNLLPVGQD